MSQLYAGNKFFDDFGNIITNVHMPTDMCVKVGCCIHAPTLHRLIEFKQLWRSDVHLMERICPHGVGHPDPDHIDYVKATRGLQRAATESVHGCDGCCRKE
jgi:hypothetical protein